MHADLLKPLLAQTVRLAGQLLAAHGAKVADEGLAIVERYGQRLADHLQETLIGGGVDPLTQVYCEVCQTGPITIGCDKDSEHAWVCQSCARVLGWDGVTSGVAFAARVFGTRPGVAR